MNINNSNTLLPSGFHDILAPYARREFLVIYSLMQDFAKFGYEQVKPPMVEFETSLVSEKTKHLSTQTFRMMDPQSQEMMGIRTDITTQIARIASLRLKNKARPLRLSYTGQVLRVKGQGLNAERQLAQAGIELIGSNSIEADIEAVSIAISSLTNIGIKNISVDFGIPSLSERIMDDFGTPSTLRQEIFDFIEVKDIKSLDNIDDDAVETLVKLIKSAGSADNCLKSLDEISIPKAGIAYIEDLKTIIKYLNSNFDDISLTIDPIERRGFEYHSGISFSLFSKDSNEELGRGGRYLIDNKEDAIGFTLNVNALGRICDIADGSKRILIPADTPLERIIQLQNEGYSTVTFFEESNDIGALAAKHNCQFALIDNIVQAKT